MSLFSFFSKIPWMFLISKTPQIVKTVENFANRRKIEKILPDPSKNDFAALEKLIIEQARLIAAMSDNVEKINNEIKEIKENFSLLFLINVFSFILIIILTVISIAMYIK